MYITSDKSKIDFDKYYEFILNSYWGNDRSISDMQQSCENSLCFALFDNGNQIGIAKVITDYTFYAYLCDVYIDEQYRGQGYGYKLIDYLLNHPSLKKVKKVRLVTNDAQEFYRKLGFGELQSPDKHMELVR